VTELNHYVNYNDNLYQWQLSNMVQGEDYTVYNIFVTSQRWLTKGEVDIYIWQHWLQVYVPTKMTPNANLGLLFIDGGGNPIDVNNPPGGIFEPVKRFATSTGTIAGYLGQIPNQPAVFKGQWNVGRKRSEDALIAYTWSHFINNTFEYDWLARMPMTKASIVALDVLQEFQEQYLPDTPLTRFCVGGASKRGWTTWMVGGMGDPRVVGIMPLVAPVANLVPQINEMWQSYGNWSFALYDYVEMDLMGWLNTERFEEMLHYIDPLSYPEALGAIPKYVVCALGDEFFMPDAARYYWDQLLGSKSLYLVPNAEHSLAGHIFDVLGSGEQFYMTILYNQTNLLPTYSWIFEGEGNTVTLITNQTDYIVSAKVYYSQNNTNRDWRLITCAEVSPSCVNLALWGNEDLTYVPNSPGVYTYTLPMPPPGMYSAMMIEISYDFGYSELTRSSRKPYHITSNLSIFPQTYPYPPCPEDVCECGYDCLNNYYVTD